MSGIASAESVCSVSIAAVRAKTANHTHFLLSPCRCRITPTLLLHSSLFGFLQNTLHCPAYIHSQICSCVNTKINFQFKIFNIKFADWICRNSERSWLLSAFHTGYFRKRLCFHASREAACPQLSLTFSHINNLRFTLDICHFSCRHCSQFTPVEFILFSLSAILTKRQLFLVCCAFEFLAPASVDLEGKITHLHYKYLILGNKICNSEVFRDWFWP